MVRGAPSGRSAGGSYFSLVSQRYLSMRNLIPLLFLFSCLFTQSQNGLLKYVVYDFDGLNTGQTALPDGDYSHGDVTYSIAENPLSQSHVLGDRVLRADLNWQGGTGEFGKATMRYLELNATTDRLNFYFYNPLSNSESALVDVLILEDDNNNDVFDGADDDKWTFPLTIQRSGEWLLMSIPLSSFQDGNTAGNGVFDAGYSQPGGMLFSVALVFKKPVPTAVSDQYFIDMICFSDGTLPTGTTVLDLPPGEGGAKCMLGALGGNPDPSQVPGEIHAVLPAGKKLAMVNWFVYYSKSGTTADEYTGSEVQQLLDNGFTPVITWESMYAEYSRLDPVQPRLDAIINGSFDAYIDAFAAKIKSYNGGVIMRIFHEFEGDWYSWSLAQNGQDPAKYINAYRHVVNRFRAVGANNVQWMWCLNAEPKPYARFNWVVSCYPGDEYVDIVATDIYNHPDLGTPDWKSFRYTMAESYYYLVKYYSHKPLYVCEVGSRERNSGEPATSQSKAGWTCSMSRDLKSYFSKTRALIFFSTLKEHDWRINSSDDAKQAFVDCIWSDPYYDGVVGVGENHASKDLLGYPNPFTEKLWLIPGEIADTGEKASFRIFDMAGKTVYQRSFSQIPPLLEIGPNLPAGLYVLEMRRGAQVYRQKLVRALAP